MPSRKDIETPFPAGHINQEIARERPGRVIDWLGPETEPPAKPGPEDTPYRSLFYVTARDSADGNDYRRDDPIPYAEAFRQGQVDENGPINVADIAEAAEADIMATRELSTARVTAMVDDVRVADETAWSLRTGECPHCRGTGKRSYKVAATHKPDCGCPMCSPCIHCDGTGKAAVEAEATAVCPTCGSTSPNERIVLMGQPCGDSYHFA